MLEKLPLELLSETIGYIHQPSHLKALCLVSKTVSSVATQFLFCDLKLYFKYYDKDDRERMLNAFEAVAMCDGLRFVKRLKVGPIKQIMFSLFDLLIFRLPDHSLLDFEWDADAPPLNSQLAYIWDHQLNIRSINLRVELIDDVKGFQPWKNLKFPQKYENIFLAFPLDKSFLARLDLSCMRTLTIDDLDFYDQLPSPISDHLVHITNLQLHSVFFIKGELELDQIASLVTLGLYQCDGTFTLLSNFKNPKLKDFRTECDWDEIGMEMLEEDYNGTLYRDFEASFSFIRRFRGLETLAIAMPDSRHPGTFLRDLTDSISSKHNDTLRRLALIDAWNLKDRDKYTLDTTESRNSVYDAVMVCPHLVDLELPTEWKTKEIDFKRITDNLPSLKVLCLRFHLPWEPPAIFYYRKELPFQLGKSLYQVAASLISNLTDTSNLKLLSFDLRSCCLRDRRCFLRGWSDSKPPISVGIDPMSEHIVKYHIPGYEPLPNYAHLNSWRRYR